MLELIFAFFAQISILENKGFFSETTELLFSNSFETFEIFHNNQSLRNAKQTKTEIFVFGKFEIHVIYYLPAMWNMELIFNGKK